MDGRNRISGKVLASEVHPAPEVEPIVSEIASYGAEPAPPRLPRCPSCAAPMGMAKVERQAFGAATTDRQHYACKACDAKVILPSMTD